jgi:CubicO group peptidase (beta-lactamase class C family)
MKGHEERRRWRWLAAALAVPVLLVGVVLLLAPVFTGTSQWARVIAWQDADVGDRDRFSARPIANAPPVAPLLRPDDPGRYAPLWDSLRPRRDGAETAVAFQDLLAQTNTTAFLVLLGDTLLFEWYGGGMVAESVQTSFSVAKSILSLAVGIAIADGSIHGLDVPVTELVTELAGGDPRFAAITLRHLLTMSSGLEWTRSNMPWGDPATTYYAPDLRRAALSARIGERPGARFVYNNYNPLLVGLALERATGRSVSAFIEERLWRPLGAAGGASWSLDSERSGFEKMESGFNARADDYARLGLLMLRRGVRDGDTLVPPAWVAASTRPDSSADPSATYQFFFWVAPSDSGPSPFWAEGRFGQFIWISPADSLVMVRLGREDGGLRWVSVFERVARRARDMVEDDREQPVARGGVVPR